MAEYSRKLVDDCFLHDKDRLKHNEALEILRSVMKPAVSMEEVSLTRAGQRILAQDVTAPRNVPAFNNAAVDGYAFSYDEFEPTGGFFPVSTRIAAGDVSEKSPPSFTAVRIFTGARVPDGLDTIAMQEDCEISIQDGIEYVAIPTGLKIGANRRLAGEDVETGDLVVSAGTRLRPQEIAAIASTGAAKITVFAPLKIGILSSGNEILRPGAMFEDGKVYDANHPMLEGLLGFLPCVVTDLGVIPDNAFAVQELLKNAANDFDVILSTGGASKGEEDHLVDALEQLGKQHMWQLAIKPGRPMSFGQIGDTLCFTLPGNPVAAFVCFLLYVQPSLLALGGAKWHSPARYPLPCGFSLRSKADRREFLRGYLAQQNGSACVKKYERDGSGLISGLCASSGLIEVPESTTTLSEGEMVNFIPYSEFGIV